MKVREKERESFWNHSINIWSDITSSFILNDNIICFIAFLDDFNTKMVTKKHKKIRTPGPTPFFLGPSPIFYQFFYDLLYISFHLESFHYVASNFEKIHFVFALSLADVDVYLCFPHKLLLTPSSSLR